MRNMSDITILSYQAEIDRATSSAFAPDNINTLLSIIDIITNSVKSNKPIVFFGNGGSAGEATHIAAEFTGKCVLSHEPWLAFSLSDNNSAVTAIANDYGYDQIYARQIDAFRGNLGIAVGMSTSGISKNVLEGLMAAKKASVSTVLMTKILDDASRQEISKFVDFFLEVDTKITPRCQEVHLIWGHLISELVEKELCEGNNI